MTGFSVPSNMLYCYKGHYKSLALPRVINLQSSHVFTHFAKLNPLPSPPKDPNTRQSRRGYTSLHHKMAPPTSILSRTLQSISVTKIREIEKQRSRYEERKSEVLAKAAEYPDEPHKRIQKLSNGLQDLYPEVMNDRQVENIKHWLNQARYDASVPAELLRSSEELLRSKLEVQSRRLGLAHLYSQLVTEWMDPSTPMGSVSAPEMEEGDDRASSFEVVDRQKERLQELCDKFERVIFEPLETDEAEIDAVLQGLFEGEDEEKLLGSLRRGISKSGTSLFRESNPFNMYTLKWCLRGLLAEDLISDEKRAILREFLDNEIALKEIGDVLNLRYADIESWQWQAGEDGIPVLPRQQLNGKYRMWVDEDVLQAILIEYIGVRCCISLKRSLRDFLSEADSCKVWRWTAGPKPTQADELRWKYLTGKTISECDSVNKLRRRRYMQSFMSQLPDSVNNVGGAYDDDEEDDEVEASEEHVGARDVKKLLLNTITTEVIFGRSLRGEVAVVQSDLQWFGTGLSHTTIFAVMSFFGVPKNIVDFFRKVVEAPLNIAPVSGRGGGPRVRRRGVPMAHAVEKFIGELVLFVMDLVVNQETGLLLYRQHDDLFLVGEPARCAKAWTSMLSLAKVLGLEFNRNKTGSVYLTKEGKARDPAVEAVLPKGRVEIGHLKLDTESGEWVIDQKLVQSHITQLGTQLASCDSILSWVQTWNSCIGRFFSHVFGEPAFCLGIKHLDSILETYKQMQITLFSNTETTSPSGGSDTTEAGDVATYLREKIKERFGVSDVPRAFIFLPEQLGGLGVRNPFIPMLVLRETMVESGQPEEMVQEWLEEEEDDYRETKKSFEELSTREERLNRMRHGQPSAWGASRARSGWGEDWTDGGGSYEDSKEAARAALTAEQLDTFPTFEEYARWQEATSEYMLDLYTRFTSPPPTREPSLDPDVQRMLSSAGLDSGAEPGWMLQMSRGELLDRYGSLRLVDGKFLTLGVLAMMRSKAVRWNMVL